MSQPKRKRSIPIYVWMGEAEHEEIRWRTEEAGTQVRGEYQSGCNPRQYL